MMQLGNGYKYIIEANKLETKSKRDNCLFIVFASFTKFQLNDKNNSD